MDALTPEMAALKTWMIVSAVLYAIGGLNFIIAPNLLLENLNRASKAIFKDRLPLIPLSTEKFWLVLTIAMMFMLVAACVMAAADVEKYYMMVVIILFSKAASTIQYIVHFIQRRFFAYLVGALTDGPLFVITLYFFMRAV